MDAISPIRKKRKEKKERLEEQFKNWVEQLHKNESEKTPSVLDIPTSRWVELNHMIRSPAKSYDKKPYEIFCCQAQAFDCVNKLNSINDPTTDYCYVFSKEIDDQGKRIYIVSSLSAFWDRYSEMPSTLRHYYEVIRENQPCHLYFDLEYGLKYTENQQKNTEILMSYFRQFIIWAFHIEYGIQCNEVDFIELYASSEKKFSCHVIIRLKDTLFSSNVHCGYFVKKILFYLTHKIDLQSQRPLSDDTKLFTVNISDERKEVTIAEVLEQFHIQVDENGGKGLFIDLSVYTKNRNFRLYGSSKLAGSPALYLESSNTYSFPDTEKSKILSRKQLNYYVFLHSLICYTGKHFKSDSLTSPSLLHCDAPSESIRTQRSSNSNSLSTHIVKTNECNFPEELITEVHEYIAQVVQKRPGNNGYIRSRIFLPEQSYFVFRVANNRYCENVKREHKSNNVGIIVDTTNGVYYQKCLDDSCSTFIAEKRPLPELLRDKLQFFSPAMDSMMLDMLEKNAY